MKTLKIIVISTIVLVMTAGLCGCTTFDNFKAAFIDKNQDSGSSAYLSASLSKGGASVPVSLSLTCSPSGSVS